MRLNTSPRKCTLRCMPSATAWATLDLPAAMAPVAWKPSPSQAGPSAGRIYFVK
jgi:hypothetical protein